MATVFSRGAKVTIYSDPLTVKQPEGQAKLIRHLKTVAYGFEPWQAVERWIVRFDGETDMVEREVRRPQWVVGRPK